LANVSRVELWTRAAVGAANGGASGPV